MGTIQGTAVADKPDGQNIDRLQLQLVLISRDGTCWLIQDRDGTCHLPTLWIPKWRRVAQEATKAARNELGTDIFCLWEIREASHCYLVARVNASTSAKADLIGAMPQELPALLHEPDEVRIVLFAHNEAFANPAATVCNPFTRIDWDLDLQRDLRPVLMTRGVRLTGQIDQFNSSETFSLLRLGTNDSPLWFKAVGEPNLAEYSVTIALSKIIPDMVPRVIANFPSWNGWVSEDCGGIRLDECLELSIWEFASSRLAELQIASIQHVDELLAAGCIDFQSRFLIASLDNFVSMMHQAMEADPELDIVRMELGQLRYLSDSIKVAISAVNNLNVPEALVHRDLSGGNILASPNSCTFIDWAQACISHPFICLEYMLVHLAQITKGKTGFEGWAERIASTYASRWHLVLSREAVDQALTYTPLLAAYLYVLPSNEQIQTKLLATTESRKLLRSMTRRMWKEMTILETSNLSTLEP